MTTLYLNASGGYSLTPQTFGAVGDGVTDDTLAIQAALDQANGTSKGVVYFPSGTYKITNSLTTYEKIQLIGEGKRTLIKSYMPDATKPMLKLPAAGGENFINISLITFNGNSLALSCIDNNANSYTYIHDCYFLNAVTGLDFTDGGYFARIEHNSFVATTFGISINGSANAMLITNNEFEGAQTYPIFLGATNSSDSVDINTNYFGTTATTDCIRVQVAGGYQGRTTSISNNRFDCSPSNSQINILQYAQATIKENSCAAAITNLIKIDGTHCDVRNNYLASSTGAAILVTANATQCRIGHQNWATGGVACNTQITDNGSRTWIERIYT